MWNAPPEVPEVSPAQTASFAPAAPVGTGLYGVDDTGQTWQYVPPGVVPLAAPGGPFLPTSGGTMTGPLNFVATGATAVRSAQDRAAERFNVRDFGAIGDGATNDSAAVQATFAAAAAGGEVWFPKGTYVLASAITQTVTGNIAVHGAGSGVSTLLCSASGISLTMSSNALATIADISLVNNAATTQGTGIAVTAPDQSTTVDLRNVVLRGNTATTTGWQTALSLVNIGNPTLDAILITAPNGNATATGITGIYYSGTSGTATYATGFKMTNSLIQGGQYGLSIGPYVQGVYVAGCDIIGNDYGVYWPASSGLPEWLAVTAGSHTNCTTCGILATNVGWVTVQNTLHIRFTTLAASWTAIDCETSHNIAIGGNNIYGNGGSNIEHAIVLNNCTTQPATITGNAIGNIGGAAAIVVSGDTGNLSCVGNSGNGILGGFISDTTGLTTNQYLGNISNGASTGNSQLTVRGLTLNDPATPLLYYANNGTGVPAFTTRSAGAKIVVWPALSGTSADYALGIETTNMWFGLPTASGHMFRFFGGTTPAAALTGDGQLYLVQGFSVWNGTPPASKPTVTGSRGGNAALQSLVAALEAYGLIADNTTP